MKAALLGLTVLVVAIPTSWSLASEHPEVGPGGRRCFEVGGSPGDAAVVNLTPVLAQGAGHGVLVSSDVGDVPTASSVNYSVGSVAPNVAVAPIGADGRVCFVNGDRAGVQLVADHLGTIDGDSYRSATSSGAPLRLIDTRTAGGTGARPAPPARTGSSVCTLTNPNEPTDDPNPIYNGTEGRDFVSADPVPAGFPTTVSTGLCGVGLRPADLTPSGGMTITTDGTVIDGMDISGTVHIRANNVTIRNSRITSGDDYTIEQHDDSSGLVIEDTRIRGLGTVTTVRLREHTTIRRTHISGGKVSLRASGGFLIEDSYLTGTYRVPSAHNDIIWVNVGTNYVIRDSTLIAPWRRGTASIFFHAKNDGGGGNIDNVLVEDNYISGGGFAVYTVDPDFSLTNARVLNNRVELGSYRYGPFNNTAGATISGNTLLPSN